MTTTPPSLLVTVRRARWWPQLTKAITLLRTTLTMRDQHDYLAAEVAYRQWYATEDPLESGRIRAEADQRFPEALADVASAAAILHFAVDRRWLYRDELDTAREYFAGTPARVPAERILAGVEPRSHPAHEDLMTCVSLP